VAGVSESVTAIRSDAVLIGLSTNWVALIASLPAVVTALAAMGALFFSLRTSSDVRKRELQEASLQHFQETSINVSSVSPALRSVGLENMARYLSHPEYSETALRVMIYSFLLESDTHLRNRVRDLLVSHARDIPELLGALARINRETWRLIISTAMSNVDPNTTGSFDQLIATLELTKQAISAVLRERPVEAVEHQRSIQRVDLSGIRLDGTDLSGVSLIDTNLRWASLSFCNLHRARLLNCDMSFTVLVGAYMENARIAPSQMDHTVFCGGRFENTELLFPENQRVSACFSSHEGILFSGKQLREVPREQLREYKNRRFSVCLGRELTWPALWVSSLECELTAVWESEVDRSTVTARMEIVARDKLNRNSSSDGNDGEYRIDRRVRLDPLERYDLVVGTRRLCKEYDEIPRDWYGIWWNFGAGGRS
jgi:hypothetical protein